MLELLRKARLTISLLKLLVMVNLVYLLITILTVTLTLKLFSNSNGTLNLYSGNPLETSIVDPVKYCPDDVDTLDILEYGGEVYLPDETTCIRKG